jgi:LPXTG-site transpeptidase (sortase) family protein
MVTRAPQPPRIDWPSVRRSRRRGLLSRLRHALVPRRRLNRLQWAAVVAMALATVGVAIALTVLTRSGTSPAPPTAPPDAPALLPTLAAPLTPAPNVGSVPATVRLIVPAGGINIPVVEGDGVHVPLHLAMHYPGTSEPGAGSNSLFYAHGQPGMFLGLYSVHVGDEIRAVRADGTVVEFHVSDIHRVPWNDLDVTRPTPNPQIVLLTCTSYNPHDPRYIVIGTPV